MLSSMLTKNIMDVTVNHAEQGQVKILSRILKRDMFEGTIIDNEEGYEDCQKCVMEKTLCFVLF